MAMVSRAVRHCFTVDADWSGSDRAPASPFSAVQHTVCMLPRLVKSRLAKGNRKSDERKRRTASGDARARVSSKTGN